MLELCPNLAGHLSMYEGWLAIGVFDRLRDLWLGLETTVTFDGWVRSSRCAEMAACVAVAVNQRERNREAAMPRLGC